MCGSRMFCQRVSNFENVVIVVFVTGEWVQKVLKASHNRPASETPLKWRSNDRPMMAQH